MLDLLTGGFEIQLFYDVDPLGDDYGSINLLASAFGLGGGGLKVLQDSYNLIFGFLFVDLPFVLDAPTGTFDPNAQGTYNIALRVVRPGGSSGAAASIDVVVPAPGIVGLLGLGLLGLAMAGRMKRA
ncbi:MAG: hypothetical protein EXQ94_13320 [Alphaproteobacteria bacterium]|nr:hypothetical protein [Alphaproteobacteria bacterium]